MRGSVLRAMQLLLVAVAFAQSQARYNHPELDWAMFETAHFRVHFTPETERTAREGAAVAEVVYPHVAQIYQYESSAKIDLIFLDTDDFSNGAAYYYDNKIEIWASPLDVALRGSHRWLQNVITHELTHIISIQKAMKFGRRMPGGFLQAIGYEQAFRDDVLYGYPHTLISLPVPGAIVPPWLAEGVAQYMFQGASFDFWDTHRDMLLRDRILNGPPLTREMVNTFGKSGAGNEMTYNVGFGLVRFITARYGEEALQRIMLELARPVVASVDRAIEQATGDSFSTIFEDFLETLEAHYRRKTDGVRESPARGKVIVAEGSVNLEPTWAPDGKRFAYLSNVGNDYFSQTDLYVFDLALGEKKRIARGVVSAPSWDSSGRRLYYAKKSRPDRRGSRWFDLYEYTDATEKEARLTSGARALSPVLLPGDSLLAYIGVRDGTHNVFLIHLSSRRAERLTDFPEGRQLFGLRYDIARRAVLFDYTDHHFRNIGYVSLSDTSIGHVTDVVEWDERDPATLNGGGYLYSTDKSGVYNLFLLDPEAGRQGYVTNQMGGAFMPDVHADGKVLYSLFENGKYSIALLDSLALLDEQAVGYGPEAFQRFADLPPPLLERDSTTALPSPDVFPPMFLFPRLMIDYGTLKPGLFFSSTEVLNRLGVLGAASANAQGDLDLFLSFEFHKWYPTLFTEVAFVSRQLSESTQYVVYDLDYSVKFKILQWDAGLRLPIAGDHHLTAYVSFQRFREDYSEAVEGQTGKIAFDYFLGRHGGVKWESQAARPTVDGEISPSNGFSLLADLRYESDRFFRDFAINEDYSTYLPVYDTHRFWRWTSDGAVHWAIPRTRRWTTTLSLSTGWMSTADADSFFNFFAGGLPGLRGYPYYSLEGNRMAVGTWALRVPIFRERHIGVGPLILQNLVVGLVAQAGDAWNAKTDTIRILRSVGVQLRLGGFAFYNYPTGIAVELHRGLDKFSAHGESFPQGMKPYFSVLFGF